MNHYQGGDADHSEPVTAPEQADAAADAARQDLQGQDDEGRLRKAAGEVKEILKNSRHQ